MNTRSVVFGGLLCATIGAVSLNATPVDAGSFGVAGTMYVNFGSIQFYLNSLGDNSVVILGPSSGAFSALAFPQTAKMDVLPETTGPLSVPSNLALPDSITLSTTSIPVQTSAMYPNCSDSAADNLLAGCTLAGDPGILLSQSATGISATISLRGNAYSGNSASGTTPFDGLLTSNFVQSTPSIFGVEQSFYANGYLSNPFTATFTTNAAQTAAPEPDMLAGFGLLILGAGLYRKKTRVRRAS